MDHGDGRFTSRFRPDYDPTRLPRVVGLCATCWRTMWTQTTHHSGRITVSADGRHCVSCARYIRETGGKDPRHKRGGVAERIPAELPETEDSWRDDPQLPLCVGIGSGPFEPDPFPEDLVVIPDAEREAVWEMRRYIAAHVCAACPVRRQCDEAALTHGYEGLWGGRFYTRLFWQDLVTGARGPTIHASAAVRVRMVAALRREGYDAHGEPLVPEPAR